jgi:hypothetical protein
MSRRITLPGADELFRNTEAPGFAPGPAPRTPADEVERVDPVAAAESGPALSVVPADASIMAAPERPMGASVRSVRPSRTRRKAADRRPTGREAHDEKITVYVSGEELIDLEQAKISLRSEHGMAVDRGRIVREAVAIVLADLDARGEDSIIVRRLRGI